MNQKNWKENKLLETKEQPPPITASHTNTPQVQTEKRSKKKVSHSIIEVPAEDFQVYKKRAKNSHTPNMLKEGET